jgi:hypothetical protein
MVDGQLRADGVAKVGGAAALIFQLFFPTLHQFVRREWLAGPASASPACGAVGGGKVISFAIRRRF